ncbi:GNAT family N-acetyltransferase [Bradyrhizobium sp.]|uniref:GNAT family N-acetyltransferase n=1 Tax=Bradyrhizobium sp. TaxID=376 RepID=UPI001D544F12|nr:GNAT family N-acetyltransferase [Bradyrhizobium sp.]MBI5319361.1 GNAT family N-acetyltransferase [Bradyrhizobium sp.]
MPLLIRVPDVEELPALSELCMRSKAVWGYDAAFMEACRGELSLHPRDLASSRIAIAARGGNVLGVAQVRMAGDEADLVKLFVEPAAMRSGVGQALFAWAVDAARASGAARMTIEADPDAAPFYRRLGARDAGLVPSGSIAGRMLPKLVLAL